MLRVVSLGTIVPDSHFVSTKLGQNYFLPNGFSVDRSIFKNTSEEGNASSAPAKKGKRQLPVEVNTSVVDRSAGHPFGLYFTATISAKPQASDEAPKGKKGKGAPLYTVTRSDAPTEKRYEGEGCSSVWVQALADAEKDFADRAAQLLVRSPETEKSSFHGMDFFGVYLPEVVKAIAGLSGAAEAAATVPAKARKAKEKTTTEKQGKKSASPAKIDVEDTPLYDLVGATKAKKPRRSAAKTAAGASAAASAPAPPAAQLPCPDCGLVNTPFCAATGKPHVASVCPKCGLSSAFCPVTGEAHTGVTQREGRQRGEVHLPGAKRSARKKKAPAGEATVADGEVHEVTVIATQQPTTPAEEGEVPKKRRRSSAKTAIATATAEGGEATAEGAEVPAGEAGEEGAPKKRRTRSKKAAATAVGPDGAPIVPAPGAEESTTAPAGGEAAPAGGEAAPAPAPPEPPVPEEPKEYEYPPLRPPMSNNESNRALHIMHKALREQPEQQHLLPCVAALRMPFISVRVKTDTATTKKRARKGKAENEEEDKVKQEKNEQGDNDDADDENKANKNNNEEDAKEDDKDKEGAVDKDNEEQQNKEEETKGAAAAVQLSVHPLEVRDVGTSLAGKRYMKFMTQYTSERTKLDAIRKNSTHASEPKRGRQKTSAPEAVAGAEAEEEKKAAEATTGLVDRSDDISTVQLSAVKLEEPLPPTASVPQAEEPECGEDIAATQKIS